MLAPLPQRTDNPGCGDGLPASIHALPVPEVYQALGSRPQGLTLAESAARRQRFGHNRLREVRPRSLVRKFLGNFTHLMALLLWAGGLVGFLARMPQLGLAIWLVNLINGAFSFWQEYKAERAMAALRRLLPTSCRVLRGGEEQQILVEHLVPGDVLLLGEGDHISADARLVEAAALRADQSTLTGESMPRQKAAEASPAANPPRAEISNLVFAGTSILSGTGKAVVFATSMETEFGKIAHLTQSVGDEPSPLQKEMGRVTRVVTLLATGIGLLFFLLAVLVAGVNLSDSFIFAMGMIVAFVPEGMLPTVTLSLAMGVQRMARRHALVKQLSAVEALGCTTVICTDKTGTLTENEMTVRELWCLGQRWSVSGAGYESEGQILQDGQPISQPAEGDLHALLLAAGLCNNSRLRPSAPGSPHRMVLGDPTEVALRVVAAKGGLDLEAEARRAPRLRELPFDSARKRMTILCQGPGSVIACVKGAPKEVLALCTRIRLDGREVTLDKELRARIIEANDGYARDGLRVLAVAQRTLPAGLAHESMEAIECELTFLGLMALLDPPRPEVPAAIEKCHRAGIRVLMITGDYELTAESIARRIGLVQGDHVRIVRGTDLDRMDDQALREALREDVIFARVNPESKLRVVRALREMGHIVAVTGDGVNDAPALKRADIGVAMGVAGTEVAKEASDMILTDDNFASIVNAVEEGRAVYANMRRFAIYFFNSNMAEAVPFIVMLFSGGRVPLPLTVMQVLAISLGTDVLPAIGLGAEAPEAGDMGRPPRSQAEPLLNGRLLARALLWYGLIESLACMSAYFYLNWRHGWPAVPLAGEGTLVYRMATTMTLAGIVAAQVGAVFGCRTDRRSIFSVGFFTNRLVLLGVGIELALLVCLAHFPWLQRVFHTAPIGPSEWLFVFAWTPVLFVADELRKALLRGSKKRFKPRGSGSLESVGRVSLS
jgi:magnesium-transporting ATPase (P-type)